MTTTEATNVIPFVSPEVVDTVDCSCCDTPIVPEVEDFDTALQCSCGSWHHYEHCAPTCVEYVDNLRQDALEDAARDEWVSDLS